MKTKASPIKIVWLSAVLVFMVLAIGLARTPERFQVSSTPQLDRTLSRKPWSVEPVRVIAAKNKKKANLEIGKTFDDDDDWLDGFTITVINNSDKTVTAVTVDMIFRREPGDTRPPVVDSLHFGPSPIRPEYNLRDRSKVINVGHTADLELSSQNYNILRNILEQKGYSSSIKRVELVIREVGFEDGSVLRSGALWVQDLGHPDDPTRKIRAGAKPPGIQRNHVSTLLDRKAINTKGLLLKRSPRLPNARIALNRIHLFIFFATQMAIA